MTLSLSTLDIVTSLVLYRAKLVLSEGTEFFYHHWFTFDVLFNSPGACTKLLFTLRRVNDCVNVKSKLNKDVGEPPPWGYPQRTPPPVRLVSTEPGAFSWSWAKLPPDSCTLPARRGLITQFTKLLSVCLREWGPCNKSTADPLTNVSWIQFRRSWERGLYS